MAVTTEQQPVDLAHLGQYTGGDFRVNAEVLRLFAGQSASVLERLRTVLDSLDSHAWREAAHSLKGAALGIGAFGFATAAGIAENLDPAKEHARAADSLTALHGHNEVVQAFIAAYLTR